MSIETKRSVRTILQSALGFLLLFPVIVQAVGLSASLPWVAGGLALSGAVARVMAVPAVQARLPKWLSTAELTK